MRAVLLAQINKTDRNDARGIAQMMRAGLYRQVHVNTLRSQKLRMLLTHRKLLQSKAIAIDNDLRGTLRNFGLKVGVVGALKFEARIKELVENLPDLAELIDGSIWIPNEGLPSSFGHCRLRIDLDTAFLTNDWKQNGIGLSIPGRASCANGAGRNARPEPYRNKCSRIARSSWGVPESKSCHRVRRDGIGEEARRRSPS